MRRPTVLSLPPQLVFPDIILNGDFMAVYRFGIVLSEIPDAIDNTDP